MGHEQTTSRGKKRKKNQELSSRVKDLGNINNEQIRYLNEIQAFIK
jgi:hypothetical protein